MAEHHTAKTFDMFVNGSLVNVMGDSAETRYHYVNTIRTMRNKIIKGTNIQEGEKVPQLIAHGVDYDKLLVEAKEGKPPRCKDNDGIPGKHILSFDVSADGKRMYSGSSAPTGEILVWDIVEYPKRILHRLPPLGWKDTNSAAFTPYQEGQVKYHTGPVMAVKQLTNEILVSASLDGTIIIWDNIKSKKATSPPTCVQIIVNERYIQKKKKSDQVVTKSVWNEIGTVSSSTFARSLTKKFSVAGRKAMETREAGAVEFGVLPDAIADTNHEHDAAHDGPPEESAEADPALGFTCLAVYPLPDLDLEELSGKKKEDELKKNKPVRYSLFKLIEEAHAEANESLGENLKKVQSYEMKSFLVFAGDRSGVVTAWIVFPQLLVERPVVDGAPLFGSASSPATFAVSLSGAATAAAKGHKPRTVTPKPIKFCSFKVHDEVTSLLVGGDKWGRLYVGTKNGEVAALEMANIMNHKTGTKFRTILKAPECHTRIVSLALSDNLLFVGCLGDFAFPVGFFCEYFDEHDHAWDTCKVLAVRMVEDENGKEKRFYDVVETKEATEDVKDSKGHVTKNVGEERIRVIKIRDGLAEFKNDVISQITYNAKTIDDAMLQLWPPDEDVDLSEVEEGYSRIEIPSKVKEYKSAVSNFIDSAGNDFDMKSNRRKAQKAFAFTAEKATDTANAAWRAAVSTVAPARARRRMEYQAALANASLRSSGSDEVIDAPPTLFVWNVPDCAVPIDEFSKKQKERPPPAPKLDPEPMCVFNDHYAGVSSLWVEGNEVYSASYDQTILVWHAQTRHPPADWDFQDGDNPYVQPMPLKIKRISGFAGAIHCVGILNRERLFGSTSGYDIEERMLPMKFDTTPLEELPKDAPVADSFQFELERHDEGLGDEDDEKAMWTPMAAERPKSLLDATHDVALAALALGREFYNEGRCDENSRFEIFIGVDGKDSKGGAHKKFEEVNDEEEEAPVDFLESPLMIFLNRLYALIFNQAFTIVIVAIALVMIISVLAVVSTPHPVYTGSHWPTTMPSNQPTSQPSTQPTAFPSRQPTRQPSRQPSRQPTSQPSMQPSRQPSRQPSVQPTSKPTQQPSEQPSGQPTLQPTSKPTQQPTNQPSQQPSQQPSSQPSKQPTAQPSSQPSSQPTAQPSTQPSTQPTSKPSSQPSDQPTEQPSIQPTMQPTCQPSDQPSSQPSMQPTNQPSMQPSDQPSSQPSFQPSDQPSSQPSVQPSNDPTNQPSMQPSSQPSCQPSSQPSTWPTAQPTSEPSIQPSDQPSAWPTVQPTSQPTLQPSEQPSSQPSMLPTVSPSFCPPYSAYNIYDSNSGANYVSYATCAIYACPRAEIVANACGCSGDTVLTLYSASGASMASNDNDNTGTCGGSCSVLVYLTTEACQMYQLQEGCSTYTGSCSASVLVSGGYAQSHSPTPAPTRGPTAVPTAPTCDPTPPPSAKPSPAPSRNPSPGPSREPSPAPTSAAVTVVITAAQSKQLNLADVTLYWQGAAIDPSSLVFSLSSTASSCDNTGKIGGAYPCSANYCNDGDSTSICHGDADSSALTIQSNVISAIDEIVIVNRQDCCQNRFNGASVVVYYDGMVDWQATVPDTAALTYTFNTGV